MALQILVNYKDCPVTYNVVMQDDDIYHLRLSGNERRTNGEYIPEKIIIRKKGKIWISDLDNYNELVNALTEEIIRFNVNPLRN